MLARAAPGRKAASDWRSPARFDSQAIQMKAEKIYRQHVKRLHEALAALPGDLHVGDASQKLFGFSDQLRVQANPPEQPTAADLDSAPLPSWYEPDVQATSEAHADPP